MLDETRNCLRHVYFPIKERLPTTASSPNYLKAWKRLATAYNITEENTRRFFRDKKRCCNLTCFQGVLKLGKPDAEDIFKCDRCKRTYYCGRECQKL